MERWNWIFFFLFRNKNDKNDLETYIYVNIIIKIENAVKVFFFVSSWYLMCIDCKVLPKIINCIYPYLQRKASSEGNSKPLHYCVRWNRQKVASKRLFYLHSRFDFISLPLLNILYCILPSQGYCFRFNIKQVQNNDCGCGKMSQNGSFKDSLCSRLACDLIVSLILRHVHASFSYATDGFWQ